MANTKLDNGWLKKLWPMVLVVVGLLFFIYQYGPQQVVNVQQGIDQQVLVDNSQLLAAYQNKVTKQHVTGSGVIVKVLRDDKEGTPHQRILLRVSPKQTVLIAHNIDVAERVPNLRIGERLYFDGEYIWNNKGGVIHWTHKATHGKHAGGWLMYQGKRYQ